MEDFGSRSENRLSDPHSVSRKQLLQAGAMGAFSLASGNLPASPGNETPPWFDVDYDALPSLDVQLAGLSSIALAAQQKSRSVADVTVTGLPEAVNDFDREIAEILARSGLVGASLSIAVDKRLTYTRGFGKLSSRESLPATPTSLGYIGSITKPLCVMTALTLVRLGKLDLDKRVLEILPLEPLLKPGEARQPEIDQVTVRMLMNHTSGLFNIVEDLFDPPYFTMLAKVGRVQLVHGEASQYDLVRRGMSRPFVSSPGLEYHYSGQGLQVLGRIIEILSKQRLDKAMRSLVLKPLGIKRCATMSYLPPATLSLIDAGVASKTGTFIPSPYNSAAQHCQSWSYEKRLPALYGNHWGQADACGATMLSSIDLLRFLAFFPSLFDSTIMREIVTLPKLDQGQTFTGLGWGTSNHAGRYQIGHSGAFGGIQAFCEYTWDDVQYAIVVAGDGKDAMREIMSKTVAFGRSLRDRKSPEIGWSQYGFASG